ncbi:hypothetical protein T11_9562 [Trichinella zimbabwensis]|uniref:Uncharacterized protein n=1 Tax=Trichinella zimbabwensis TaxID=268475 RepID=A0A0V1H0V3_9BILA|nr:hypothetical protein T11_9562 [Trichinella zimbabwensis]
MDVDILLPLKLPHQMNVNFLKAHYLSSRLLKKAGKIACCENSKQQLSLMNYLISYYSFDRSYVKAVESGRLYHIRLCYQAELSIIIFITYHKAFVVQLVSFFFSYSQRGFGKISACGVGVGGCGGGGACGCAQAKTCCVPS